MMVWSLSGKKKAATRDGCGLKIQAMLKLVIARRMAALGRVLDADRRFRIEKRHSVEVVVIGDQKRRRGAKLHRNSLAS